MIEAIRKTVLVDFTPEEAFELFTTRVSSWWPRSHSYGGEKVTDIRFEPHVGGMFYEVTDEGQAPWGRVIAWEPPHRLVLEWLIVKCGGLPGTEVEVRFSPEGPGTRVELEHRGWERAENPSGRDNYNRGWDVVLAPFVESASKNA
jgi:uncharacterized protein YndB with AHSA1/START domain